MSNYSDPFPIPLLVNALIDETTSDPIPIGNCEQHWHGVEFAPGTTSGVVEVETAPTRSFAGTWTNILTVNAATSLTGEISYPGPGGFVRHRISTVVAGGADPKVSSYCKRINIGG